MVDSNLLWGIVTIGGPILFVVVVLWAMTNNRRTREEKQRTEAATAQLYEEQNRADLAAEHHHALQPHIESSHGSGNSEVRDARNISTEHQTKGDARVPSDTLDRPDGAAPAKDWQPGEDEGRTAPAGIDRR